MINKVLNSPPQEKETGLQTPAKSNDLWDVQMISNFGDSQEKGMFFGLSILFNSPHYRRKHINKVDIPSAKPALAPSSD